MKFQFFTALIALALGLVGCSNSKKPLSESVGKVSAHRADECPRLGGSYQSQNRSMTVFEKIQSDGLPTIQLGEGSPELIVDGQRHVFSNHGQAVTYQVSCVKGEIKVEVSNGSVSGQIRYHIQGETLVEESTGAESYRNVWRRI